MLQWILSSIITNTFEQKIGKWQEKKEHSSKKGMLITFKLTVNHEIEDGYRWLDILIYAPMNYVGVIARERSNTYLLSDVDENDETLVFKKGKGYVEKTTDWESYAYHDSCWTDGIKRILSIYNDRLNILITYRSNDWYETQIMTPDFIEAFEIALKHQSTSQNPILHPIVDVTPKITQGNASWLAVTGTNGFTKKERRIIKTIFLKYKDECEYEDPEFPREKWREDVKQEKTFLGYFDWIIFRLEELP